MTKGKASGDLVKLSLPKCCWTSISGSNIERGTPRKKESNAMRITSGALFSFSVGTRS
jgi:hypothetical protein